MPRKVDYLLIGGGLASANCARWLREEGADGEILLVGRESDPPYNRPECSKGYLRGEEERSEAYFRPDEWWQEQRIELLTRTTVTGLDLATRTAKLSTKEEVGFGQALIATGANVRRLGVTGCELEGIHYLRSFGNADAIRAGAADAEEVVLIGGSFIACEVAASLRAMGKAPVIVMQEDVTLERAFGERVGRFIHESLEAAGVRIHGGEDLERFEGDRARREGRDQAWAGSSGRHSPWSVPASAPTCSLRAKRASRSASAGACAPARACRAASRASTRRATSANTSRCSTTAPACVSSTGTSPSTTARPLRSTCSAGTSRTRWRRTSTRCSRASANSSTSAPP